MENNKQLTQGSLFTGFGMFDYAAEKAGLKNIWQVEINEFCQKLLKVRYPNAKRFKDIKEIKGEQLGYVDVISGGFPCQPFSQAEKRKGKEDDRYLWEEMLRIIRELKPKYVIGENVANIINMGLENMLSDLEDAGYGVETFLIPACAVRAIPRRSRIWIVAYSESGNDGAYNRKQGKGQKSKFRSSSFESSIANSQNKRLEGCKQTNRIEGQESNDEQLDGFYRERTSQNAEGGYSQSWIEVATELCRMDATPSGGILESKYRKQRLVGLGIGFQWEIA